MNVNNICRFKHTPIFTALALSLGSGPVNAAPLNFSGSFTFIDAAGVVAPPDATVTGILDPATATGSFTTLTPFNGFIWLADVDTMFQYDTAGPATQTFQYQWENRRYTTYDSSLGTTLSEECRVGVTINSCQTYIDNGWTKKGNTKIVGYDFDLTNPGQFAAGVFFDWSVNLDIPVLTTFQVTNDPTTSGGVLQVTSFDGRVSAFQIGGAVNPLVSNYIASPDAIVGNRMIVGPFPNQTPAFGGTLSPALCSYTVTAPLDLTDKAVTGTSTATINIGTATVTDINTGATFPASAVLSPNTPLAPGSDVAFNTGVSTIIWDKLNTNEVNCEATQSVTVHEWTPPADVTVTSSTPATGINLNTPTDLGGALNPNGVALDFTNDTPASGFDPGTTAVTWTATDDFGGTTTATQNVTINLPAGIAGAGCTIDLTTAGNRNMSGIFTMRDPTGAVAGSVDMTVTGAMDTTAICPNEACAVSGASLVTTQPFFGELWNATPIRLFDVGTWTFEACPGDNSTFCTNPPPPRPLSMTVKDAASNNNVPQLGAHMLFEWSVNKDIDVVVVWDVDCGASMLSTTDPDGDGIIGTKMVDGPFIGFNAAFDLTTQPGEVPIALGGFEVAIPAYKSPIAGGSPLPLNPTMFTASDFPSDASAVNSCTIDGCYGFQINGVAPLSSVDVVLPLTQTIPFYSVYRQFINGAWKTFTVDASNSVKSAPLNTATGLCPEPGSTNYAAAATTGALQDMMTPGDQCIQLTIEDNGPNDSDRVQGNIADPGGIALFPAPPQPTTATSGGGCSIGNAVSGPLKHSEWLLVGGLLALLGWRSRST